MVRMERPRGSIGLHVSALRFDRPRLARILAAAQKLTLPDDAKPEDALTLEQLEALAAEMSKPASPTAPPTP
jgi:hypothetical protein